MLPEITRLQGTLAVRSTQSALANKRKTKGGAEGSCTRKKKKNAIGRKGIILRFPDTFACVLQGDTKR